MPCIWFVARSLAIVLAVCGVLLGAQLTADAAMALRITVDPASPQVGQITRVVVLTLAPFSSHCVDDPRADMRPWWDWHPDAPSFDLKAFGKERVVDIPLVRRDAKSPYWDGFVIFPDAGAWDVRMVQPIWASGATDGERCAGSRVSVQVGPPGSLPATGTSVSEIDQSGTVALSDVAGLALLLAAILIRRRLAS